MKSIPYNPGNPAAPLDRYGWPGGYPLYYQSVEGDTLCPACANKLVGDPDPLDAITDCAANWEDPEMYCDSCGNRIKAAYGEEG